MSLSKMNCKIIEESRTLIGEEMLPHWAYYNFGLSGDSIVAFCGQFAVPKERWIDLEYIINDRSLPSVDMLHFIVEHFDSSLSDAMLRQYVLVSILEEKLLHRIQQDNHRLIRLGDDLFDGENRLSITAAGCTLVSTKLHLGVYIDSEPNVGVHGLVAYGVEPLELAEVIANQYRAEMRRLSEKAWRMRPIT